MLAQTAAIRRCNRPIQCVTVRWRYLHTSAGRLRIDTLGPVQSYVSTSRDPYLNLSIEHFLLQKSPPESTILFLYTNRPCIVIGRNQNPWVEVNLPLLRSTNGQEKGTAGGGVGHIDLVRRRSGGGTVFHDEGNVNWSVICPSAEFNRDKYAEMVVGALRSLGIDRARVNERHDIVLDQGSVSAPGATDPGDMHKTRYTAQGTSGPRPLKVSGSAYKLTRLRSLHHATCLISSPNLGIIPKYLHSPARPYIKARGVESVSSPVGNIGIDQGDFAVAVRQQFQRMHGGNSNFVNVGEELLEEADVANGYKELRSADWTYGQTPQFELRTDPLSFTARHGIIQDVSDHATDAGKRSMEALHGRSLYGQLDWSLLDRSTARLGLVDGTKLGGWLREMLEVPGG